MTIMAEKVNSVSRKRGPAVNERETPRLATAQWKYDGLCGFLPPVDIERLFWPKARVNRYAQRPADVFAEAKALCAKCPVIAECLNEALNADEKHSVWGGLDPRERRKVKRRIARQNEVPRKAKAA